MSNMFRSDPRPHR